MDILTMDQQALELHNQLKDAISSGQKELQLIEGSNTKYARELALKLLS